MLFVLCIAVAAIELLNKAEMIYKSKEYSPAVKQEEYTIESIRTLALIFINDFCYVIVYLIPFFKYFHESKEIWVNDQFLEVKTFTKKNSRKFTFIAKRNGPKIEIKSRGKVFLVDGDTLITSYWHQNWLKKKVLFDSQHGKKRLINVEKKDFEKITTSNSTIFAQKYKVTGRQDKPNGKKIDYDIWYDDKGRWVKIKFFVKKSLIEYFLVTKY